MGIYLYNMEMPTKGYRLILIHADGTAQSTDGEMTVAPVPPHGRLGDLDALMKLEVIPSDNWVFRAIEKAPTIIPEEEG